MAGVLTPHAPFFQLTSLFRGPCRALLRQPALHCSDPLLGSRADLGCLMPLGVSERKELLP